MFLSIKRATGAIARRNCFVPLHRSRALFTPIGTADEIFTANEIFTADEICTADEKRNSSAGSKVGAAPPER